MLPFDGCGTPCVDGTVILELSSYPWQNGPCLLVLVHDPSPMKGGLVPLSLMLRALHSETGESLLALSWSVQTLSMWQPMTHSVSQTTRQNDNHLKHTHTRKHID